MKIKRLAVTVFSVLFVAFTLISFFAYDKSSSVSIVCEDKSYAEKYAKHHNIDYKILSDSDKNIGLVNLDDFKYNDDGTLVSYNGDSETISNLDCIFIEASSCIICYGCINKSLLLYYYCVNYTINL